MSTTDGDDVPRDPWGNPLPPEDRAPANPQPDDFPPPFPSDPPGGAAPAPPGSPQERPPFAPPTSPPPAAPPANPAWPGDQPTRAVPPANPAWPGDQPTQATPPPGPPVAAPGAPPHPDSPYGGQPGPGWGGPGVPAQQPAYPPGQYPDADAWRQGSPWAQPRNDGLAIGALVCGILSGLCGLAGVAGLLIGPVAVVLGIVSRRRIARSAGALRGHGLATTGVVLGIIGTLVSVFWLALLIANPDLVQEMFDRFSSTTTTTG